MTRYAPTLLVGLGGSGVKVLRWIRHRQVRDGLLPGNDLLAYRGIDFDVDANSGGNTTRLGDGEFFYFDPSSIADCVGNLRAELRGSPGRPARRPFREIAEWYPDPEGRSIRYAQAEAVGARQWRPLGRIGFFLNDLEIVQALRTGIAEIEARCTTLGELRPTSICIVTSAAGGTGSGILFDVAANLRRLRPDIGVRLILLLPEFFEHGEFTSKVLSNAYATLLEIANFKNQEERFTARYPRLAAIDERQQSALFQRVYLAGPYFGERRPFIEPEEAYAHIADLLLVFLTKELRANAGSYQINDDADENSDAAALAGDLGARQVFCGFAAADIPLLTYDDLAARWASSFVQHWHAADTRRDIFASLHAPPSPDELRRLDDFVAASSAVAEADKYLSSGNFAEKLDSYIAAYQPADQKWSKESLQTFTRDLAEFTGLGAAGTPRFLEEPITAFTGAFHAKLDDLVGNHSLTPFAVIAELRALAERIRKEHSPASAPALEQLQEFHEWLGGAIDGFLAHPLLPQRIRRLEEWLQDWQKKHGLTLGRAWFAAGIQSAALRELDAAVAREETRWSGGADFVAALQNATAGLPQNQRHRARLGVDTLQALPASEILKREMERVDRSPQRMQNLATKLLEVLQKRIADGDRTRDHHFAAAGLLSDIRELFVFELQPGSRTSSGVKERFRYLSPESTYHDDAIRRAVLSAATHLFRPGRVDNALRKRTARLLIPQSFADSNGVTIRLKQLCDGLLGASVRDVIAEGAEEHRILILVEDLYHAAEELVGIYDYYNDYSRRDRALFHIRSDIPATFSDLLTVLDRPGPRFCGNPDCRHDLRGTARTEVLCPGCSAPIRNRCGNACRMDDFTDRGDRADAIERNRCPACKRPLRTYWWLCPRHGRVPADADECSGCRSEHRAAPERAPHAGHLFVCPGCAGKRIEPPFRATGRIAVLLRNGADADDFSTRVLEPLVDGVGCPKCGVDLVPRCPESGPRHLLERREDRWQCDVHPSLDLYQCGFCEYPIGADEYFCRRCHSALVDCRFCTPARLIRPVRSADRCCSRCRLPRLRPFMPTPFEDEDPSARFCSNLYGCPVGADFFASTYAPGRQVKCAICESAELSLLEVRTRSMHVDACTFCRTLFARRDGRVPQTAGASPQGFCCLCGQSFDATAVLPSAPHSFDAALRIGLALLQSRDDDDAFGILFDSLSHDDRRRMPSHIRDYAGRIRRPAVRRIVLPRLERLLTHYDSQFGCRASRSTDDGTPKNPGEAPQPPPDRIFEETVEDVLSSERVSGLRTNADFESWVAAVVRLGIDYDRFDAALGIPSIDSSKDLLLQSLRDHARVLYREIAGGTE